MNTESIIGVDLGGTNIQAARIVGNKIDDYLKMNVSANASKEVVLNEIINAVEHLIEDNTTGIGIGVPGLIDYENGIVFDMINIPSWDEVPLKSILELQFGKPVHIENDANCFALGEKRFGQGRNFKNLVGLTLGTGMGAGLILNNQLFSGTNSAAGELGMITYLDHNYEYYCGGGFFRNVHNCTGEELYKRALDNDSVAIKIFQEYGRHLGSALSMIFYAFDPDIIVLGGSISHSFEFFNKTMLDELSKVPFKKAIKKLIIKKSDLVHSPVFGAAALVNGSVNSVIYEDAF